MANDVLTVALGVLAVPREQESSASLLKACAWRLLRCSTSFLLRPSEAALYFPADADDSDAFRRLVSLDCGDSAAQFAILTGGRWRLQICFLAHEARKDFHSMANDLTQQTAAELSALYRAGKASPVEVMKAVLARTARVNPRVNCFRYIDEDRALEAARASEQRWKESAPVTALDGVPVSIKELTYVNGWAASMGSTLTDKTPVRDDAPAVARLREAGAIVFAQSTSPEFGHKAITASPLNGITRNPWKLDRTPGGSSGGAGAAVAAGLGPIAIGTDGGGSIRLPSSFCGLVGLKPTFGRVPAWPPSLFGDLSNTGPMARTALDCALMMNVIARPDPRDAYALPDDAIDYVRALRGDLQNLKVGFVLRFSDRPLDPEVAAIVTQAAKDFTRLGCHVEEAQAPFADPDFGVIWLASLQRLLQIFPEARHGEFDSSLRAFAEGGKNYTALDMVNAQATERELATAWNLFFAKYDLLLTPTVAVAPFTIGVDDPVGDDGNPIAKWFAYTPHFNLTRHPALSVPCGLNSEGLPIGLQIVSGHYRDALVLRTAARYAEMNPIRFPPLPA